MTRINLPTADGAVAHFEFGSPRTFAFDPSAFNRTAFAAAHVVADPRADNDPFDGGSIDWDATIAYRRHLWRHGLAVAEAMDTAQRGMGLSWPHALELIRRSADAMRATSGARMAAGVGTDHLPIDAARNIDDIIKAYEAQLEAVEATGADVILMASRALARIARSSDDYARVYGRLLAQVRRPAILHWLGEMFDPALAGYWGSSSHTEAMNVACDIISANAAKVDGVKISLLDSEKEVAMRRRLPASVRMYTGDDFNYAELIEGDALGYSHALLGIFDAIAPAAAAALTALGKGDAAQFHAIFAPTVPLSRHIFRAPTRYYKTGVVFLAWLNGHQDHFTMLGGQQGARSIVHFAQLLRLADAAGLISNPDQAAARMKPLLALHGIG